MLQFITRLRGGRLLAGYVKEQGIYHSVNAEINEDLLIHLEELSVCAT
jgi:hypothetical protein